MAPTRGRGTAKALPSQCQEHQGRSEVKGSPVRSRGPDRLHWFTQGGSDRRAPGRRRQQEASCTAAEYSNPPPPTAALANCRHHGYARAGEHRRDPADNLQLDGVVHLCARTGGKLRSRVANHGHRKPPLTWACAGRSRARSELLSSRSRVRKLQAACQLNSQHLLAVHVVLWLASGAKVISPNVHYLLEGSDQRSPRDPDKGAGYESVMVVLTLCSVVDAYR